MPVTYRKTGDPRIPALICVNSLETPVWLQTVWEKGPDAFYIQRNGCGHCCAAMAARLQGAAETDPAKEYARCLELWGEPAGPQDHFQTVSGIVRILESYGVKAKAYGVPSEKASGKTVRGLIETALCGGKQVIFWSHPLPGREAENPFSAGEHYVLACGYDECGRIVIANSGGSISGGVQLTDMDTVMNALFYGSDPRVGTWGECGRLEECAGIVIVG